MIDDKLLDEIEEKANAATGGSWSHEPHGKTVALYSRRGEFHGLRLLNLDDGDWNKQCNFDHIARMDPPTALSLVTEIRELRAKIADIDGKNAELYHAAEESAYY